MSDPIGEVVTKELPISLTLKGYVKKTSEVEWDRIEEEMSGKILLARRGNMTRNEFENLCQRAEKGQVIWLDRYEHSGVTVAPHDDNRPSMDEQFDVSRRGGFWVPPDDVLDQVRHWRKDKRKKYLTDMARWDCTVYSGDITWYEGVVETYRFDGTLDDIQYTFPTTNEGIAEDGMLALMKAVEASRIEEVQPTLL